MIRPVRYSDILGAPNAAELLAEYEAECSIPEIGKTAPDPAMYAAMEQAGSFLCMGAYEGEKLIGFATVMASVLPHYSRKVAIVESVFVAKEHRGSAVGFGLLDAVKNIGKQAGCQVVLYSAPHGSSFERLLERRKGCRRTNAVFCESLD